MATYFECDLCNQQFNQRDIIQIGLFSSDRIPRMDVCTNCWQDKKRWPDIHYLRPEKESKNPTIKLKAKPLK